jgi:hypothetical protein
MEQEPWDEEVTGEAPAPMVQTIDQLKVNADLKDQVRMWLDDYAVLQEAIVQTQKHSDIEVAKVLEPIVMEIEFLENKIAGLKLPYQADIEQIAREHGDAIAKLNASAEKLKAKIEAAAEQCQATVHGRDWMAVRTPAGWKYDTRKLDGMSEIVEAIKKCRTETPAKFVVRRKTAK